MRALLLATVMSVVLLASPVLAQTPPPTPPPQTPPVKPAPAPQPPAPFPEGAKIGYINPNLIAQQSAMGKAAISKINGLRETKAKEIQEKNKQLQAAQTKLQQGGSVLSDQARAQLEKDIDKMTRDIQYAQQEAEAELTDLNNELMSEFSKQLQPVLDKVASEKGLHMVFAIGLSADSPLAWAAPGLDLSAEIVKRLDAAAKPAGK
jgi:Skp family chaperone for outer membrane proteins